MNFLEKQSHISRKVYKKMDMWLCLRSSCKRRTVSARWPHSTTDCAVVLCGRCAVVWSVFRPTPSGRVFKNWQFVWFLPECRTLECQLTGHPKCRLMSMSRKFREVIFQLAADYLRLIRSGGGNWVTELFNCGGWWRFDETAMLAVLAHVSRLQCSRPQPWSYNKLLLHDHNCWSVIAILWWLISVCVQYSNAVLQVSLHFILKLNLILALLKQLNWSFSWF